MIHVRCVREDDLEGIYELAAQTKTGLSTLPHNREFLAKCIAESVPNFTRLPSKPAGEMYLFVMEHPETGRIIGTSAIFSKVGGYEPFWSYEIKHAHKESETLGISKDISYLQLKKIHNGPSEIGTLFLDPAYRHSHNGRLLSLSRFMFITAYRQCFEDRIIAEMRGVIDDKGHAVFWEALGAHFFGIPFAAADMAVTRDKSIIADLMPTHPVYIPLLPTAAQMVIGVVHQETGPARRLLEQEGFSFLDEVDIFEGGPLLGVQVDDLRVVKHGAVAHVKVVKQVAESRVYMVANIREPQDYVVVATEISILDEGGISLPAAAAKTLKVDSGDCVLYAPIRAEAKR